MIRGAKTAKGGKHRGLEKSYFFRGPKSQHLDT